ncbi:hypothetical protein SLEP1_g11500 [Rubroshorea leprosula]|uniref:ATP synthase F0 subunit 8 n=1 Tax=Rubroshorea leprosula TaxID=152421 RepID=A0AAV5IHE5_9ROSI|nr:hypothetical protein SLEP1_g11500 [Rubroshorea leprosula]
MSMESASSSPSSTFVGFEYLVVRPVLAVVFVLSFISLWWWLAWKLVLVHVPLVQEIFGLRKKPAKPKPQTRRFFRFYDRINAHNWASQW